MNTGSKYPIAFLERMKLILGEDYENFLKSLSEVPPVAVRLNPQKSSTLFNNNEPVPWCENARYLTERPIFTLDPAFQGGAYYVQEASSMFLEQAMKQTVNLSEDIKVLNLCAAPGGKATHICSLITPGSLLISNEVIRSRVPPLEQNIIKWGNSNVIITNNDPKDFQKLSGYFDVVVLDAPCSGEGLFRKDAAAIGEWSENNVNLCSARQKRILSDVVDCLKPGGMLIYSTCTYSLEENEENMQWLLGSNNFVSEKIQTGNNWKITEMETLAGDKKIYSYRFYPHKTKGEGFFISCLRKDGRISSEKDHRPYKNRNKPEALQKKHCIVAEKWLAEPRLYEWLLINDQVMAIQQSQVEDLQLLRVSLYLKHAGINMGKIINNELIPSHDLALSTAISPKIPFIELNLEQAIIYLKKQELKPDTKGMQGWVLVKYKGLNLGWIKVLTNRINNYLPKEWRIRM